MLEFDPNNQLSDEELDELGKKDFDAFLNYLDQKAEYLKKFSKPLSSYHTKRFASVSAAVSGKEFTEEDLKKSAEIGKENERKAAEKISDKLAEYEKNHPKHTDPEIKNIKTNRTQWFD